MAQSNWEADKMYYSKDFSVQLVAKFVFCYLKNNPDPYFLFSSCRLDVYIYDYLLKRNLHASAKAFMTEGKVAADPVGKKFLLTLINPSLLI